MKKEKDKGEGAIVVGGLLLGIGLGFVYGNVPAGTLIGLGAGFILFAIVKLMRKIKR